MDELALLLDLHLDGQRQGPGSDAVTQKALALSGLEDRKDLQIADIGCGTGASTLFLASRLNARITAIDFLAPFLERLAAASTSQGLSDRIETVEASMEDLPLKLESLDAIWSEGAIYNIGFKRGISEWSRFLKPGGILAVSEITWLTKHRPDALTAYWEGEYPEIDTASAKIAALEAAGYRLEGYFPLPPEAWLTHYYRPLQGRYDDFLARHGGAEEAKALIAANEEEITFFERYQAFFSYGFYIAKKGGD